MSEMLKRVADAIYSCQFGTRMAGDFSEADAEMCARAAIEAMREPTKEIIDAGSDYMAGARYAEGAWRNMIDAILFSEKPKADV